MARPLLAQLSLPALRANLARARELAPNAEVLAVVKADAYGHGLMRVLPALEDADGLALVEIDVAIALRAAGYARRILLLEGFFTADELPEIAERRIAVVVHSEAQLRMLERSRLRKPIEVFIKINTGMNRLGIAPSDIVRTVERLNNCAAVAVLRLMTHFARADEDQGIREPLGVFNAACRGMPYPRSLANSAGVVRYDEVGGEIVRPGIMLYGASPWSAESAESIGVRPVMTLRSEIIAVQALGAGECVGYGGSYTATRACRIGVVACGYADGYPRLAPYGTPVLVHGKKARIAGRVSMDMLTVDITELPEATVGSPVVLWGEGLPVDDVARAASTVGYELLCAVAPRVPFIVSNIERVDFEI
jgi:alanine racemase